MFDERVRQRQPKREWIIIFWRCRCLRDFALLSCFRHTTITSHNRPLKTTNKVANASHKLFFFPSLFKRSNEWATTSESSLYARLHIIFYGSAFCNVVIVRIEQFLRRRMCRRRHSIHNNHNSQFLVLSLLILSSVHETKVHVKWKKKKKKIVIRRSYIGWHFSLCSV